MGKKPNKDERNTGTCYNINIQYTAETVANNNHLSIGNILL